MTIYFDLDDTLFEEREFCRSAYTEIASFLSQTYDFVFSYIVPRMMEQLSRRDNPFDLLEAELKSRGLNREGLIKELVEMYRNHVPEKLPLFSDTKRTLDVLKKRGVRLGLITDGRSLTQRNKIKALGLPEYFAPEDILISEECAKELPADKEQKADKTTDVMFRKAMEMHPDDRLIYVADNTAKDFRQPNLLGWTTFCLRHMRPMIHPQDFNTAPPDAPQYIITHLPELLLI